jgi:hypothetical protein
MATRYGTICFGLNVWDQVWDIENIVGEHIGNFKHMLRMALQLLIACEK